MQRRIVTFGLAASTLLGHSKAWSQTFPNKPIHIVVPYPPGGAPDALARMVALQVANSIGQQLVVENRPGAGGAIATEYVMRAPADGYTILLADSSVYSINPNLSTTIAYQPLRDFASLTMAATSPLFLVANNGLNVNSVKDLIAVAKAKPGLAYASSGNGTAHHLMMKWFKTMAGIDLTHVPYKGSTQTMPAVVAGDVATAFGGSTTALPLAKAGKLKMLAVATPKRSVFAPDLPTVAEAGLPGFGIDITLGFLLPVKTPRDIVTKLSTEFVKAIKTAGTQEKMMTAGLEPFGTSPEQFGEMIRNENILYARLVKETGAKVD